MISSKLKNLLHFPSQCAEVSWLHSCLVTQKRRNFSSERGRVADRFSWLLSESHNSGVVDGLKKTYRLSDWSSILWLLTFNVFPRSKLQPLEKLYGFHNFHSPPLSDMDFDAIPQVLVIGIFLYL